MHGDAGSSLPTRRWLWLAACVALACAWGERYNLNPDGVSYLEIARSALDHGPAELINGYWSPGYPMLLMLPESIGGGQWSVVIPLLHLVNTVLLVLAFLLFFRLLRSMGIDLHRRSSCALAALLFAVVAVQGLDPGELTPDTLVVVALLAAGLAVCELQRTNNPARWSVLLGVILGAGYWSKGILFPVGGLLLVLLMIVPPQRSHARRGVLTAAAVFALVALPLIVLVSRRVGHLSTGEVGRLNYAWEVDGVMPWAGWTGDSTAVFGAPVHPPQLVQAVPRTLAFAAPIGGTYPLWYDASYWYAGVRARFDAAGQRAAVERSLHALADMGVQYWALWLAFGLMIVSRRFEGRRERADVAGGLDARTAWVLAAWCAMTIAAYALVHTEARYLVGCVLILGALAWKLLDRDVPRRWIATAEWAACGLLVISLLRYELAIGGGYRPDFRPAYLVDAAALHAGGLHEGDRVAAVGDAFEAYGAVTSGLRITAQVVDSEAFWRLDSTGRAALRDRLAALGVRAILANDVTATARAEGWRISDHGDGSNLGWWPVTLPNPKP